MRLALRFILPLAFVMGLIAYTIAPLVDSLTLKWFVRDLDIRSKLISNTMQDPLIELLKSGANNKIVRLFERVTQDERLFALGFCDLKGVLRFKTKTYPSQTECAKYDGNLQNQGYLIDHEKGTLHISAGSITSDEVRVGTLVIIHDMSFVDRRSADTKKYIFYFFIALAGLISFVTVLVAYFSQRGLLTGIRALLRGESPLSLNSVKSPELRPLAKDLRTLVRDLEQDRRAKDEGHIAWDARTLKNILHENLAGDEVLIVSNREPYIHIKKENKIEIKFPASGLVTALEPIMRACSGTWIAHGGGSGDREVVDKNDHVQVPSGNPSYQIRRVWLSKEEEAGYYYGFSNEGLWPLCHVAHTRPTFRTSDWEQYVAVNEKFAATVVEEASTDDPVILVQDYHFALLPKLIRKKLPHATIITFWHIPWPNAEAFGICPWREEILEGLLGSSIMGFHTQFHCNNFIDTVDRYLETRIDREAVTISYGGKTTAVQSYPISIEWPPIWLKDQAKVSDCRAKIRAVHNVSANHKIGIGIDRLDYTKGIIERFLAVERLFEMYPEWIGRFTFVQIAAPSRSIIEQYQNLDSQIRALAAHINTRFGTPSCEAISLRIDHHEPPQVFEYFRSADVCMVTSLHDGMNLVAKEFVAARDDERGVLILSQFTGASRELPEALIINPYNIDQCAGALHVALTMPQNEQRDRMRSMRGMIKEFNVYRWAGKMLMDAARMRQRQRLMVKIKSPQNFFKSEV